MLQSNFNSFVLFLNDTYKKLLSVIIFFLIRSIVPSAEYAGAKTLKNRFKSSENMFALAPGSSIGNYSEEDFSLINRYNSIGVNFFILHEFKPTLYLIETHPNRLGYFEFFKNNFTGDTPILYKGYSSHKKIGMVLKNAQASPKNFTNFLVIKDGYQRKSWSSTPIWQKNKILNMSSSDYIYNPTASILYIVYMSYKLGYKKVILCGFDMGDKYFFCDPESINYSFAYKQGLCNIANTIHNDDSRKKLIIEELIYMDNKFKTERGGGVFVYTKDGILSKYLRLYTDN